MRLPHNVNFPGTTTWVYPLKLGTQFSCQITFHRHRHPTLPTRWVFQTSAIYDGRKVPKEATPKKEEENSHE